MLGPILVVLGAWIGGSTIAYWFSERGLRGGLSQKDYKLKLEEAHKNPDSIYQNKYGRSVRVDWSQSVDSLVKKLKRKDRRWEIDREVNSKNAPNKKSYGVEEFLFFEYSTFVCKEDPNLKAVSTEFILNDLRRLNLIPADPFLALNYALSFKNILAVHSLLVLGRPWFIVDRFNNVMEFTSYTYDFYENRNSYIRLHSVESNKLWYETTRREYFYNSGPRSSVGLLEDWKKGRELKKYYKEHGEYPPPLSPLIGDFVEWAEFLVCRKVS